MPARKLTTSEGEYYHIYNRGALRMTLYYSNYMYDLFLKLIELYSERFKVTVITVCLMPNHFHLVVRVENGGSVEMFMQMLCGVYSRKVNKYQRRTGTIFEGRYHIKHVANDGYFKTLCRYIHLNPVRAALISHPSLWEYSNYLECIGRRSNSVTRYQMVIEMFGTSRGYEQFVEEDIHINRIADTALARDLAEMHIV